MTKITFMWLGYTPDSALFAESFRSVRRAMEGSSLAVSYVLADDVYQPVSKKVVDTFLAFTGTHRLATTYRRSGMLLGGENLEGQCKAFCDAAALTGADILVKIDCDAMMFKREWLEEFVSDDKAVLCGCVDVGHRCHFSVFGFIYAMRTQVLRGLYEDVVKYPAHHHAWEDHEVSVRIFRNEGGRMDAVHRFVPSPETGFPVTPLGQVNETFVNANACTFAWDYQAQAPQAKKAFRAKVGEWMKKLNDIAEKPKEEVKSDGQKG